MEIKSKRGVKLVEILMSRNVRLSQTESLRLYSLTIENGITPKSERYDREHLVKDVKEKKYKIVKPNDIVYNPANLRWGAIAISRENCDVLVSPIYEVLSVVSDNNPRYVYYAVSEPRQIKRFASMIEGTVVERMAVKLEAFLKTTISLPSRETQDSIVHTIDTWDGVISVAENLLKAKRKRWSYLARKMIKNPINNPYNWEIVALSELFERVKTKNTLGNDNVLTISGSLGLVSQVEYFNKSVASSDLTGYYFIKRGDFAYNKSYSNGYPYGAIKRLDRYDCGIVSSLYICLRPKNNQCHSDYFMHYFEAGLLNSEVAEIAREGARNHGLLNVGVKDFFSLKVCVPPIEYQEKIASVLTKANEEIEILEKYLDLLKKQRQGLVADLVYNRRVVNI
ncbi:hypothetical protein GCM10008959_24340 [Deinococcus seoulensis]|uniref:Type I restriction modification DNA specificity domain-containing protein n=1 Tax=Deinococcus seoulensis TaxID=1837379 RepID=A0ABQ2RRZ7_9DEIO|nr:restriction endonuclease subunit S [Deinococcus seoulensis]GGR61579.1 hypothetical protein GCM10008959_24340 [Deinococcus seoulensis]